MEGGRVKKACWGLRSSTSTFGTCLNGVREVIGYYGTWLEGVKVKVVMEV